MDFLGLGDISFLHYLSNGHLCEDLNNIVGQCIWYDKFQLKSTEWLWLVNDIVTTLNSDNVLCGTFGLYPSYMACKLNSVKQIHFCVLCIKHINYAGYIEKCIAGKQCTVSYESHRGRYFHLSYSIGNTFVISFGEIQFSVLTSKVIFAQSVLKECAYRR